MNDRAVTIRDLESAAAGGSPAPADLRATFEQLAARWERETRNMSSLDDITSHRSYLGVIRLGAAAVPLILDRMRSRPGFWFAALRQLTGVNESDDPVRPEMYGDLRAMTNAWLTWGAARGH